MTLATWILAAAVAVLLRRSIRAHYRRWWASTVPRRTAAVWRRPLVDPLFPILTSRRLFT